MTPQQRRERRWGRANNAKIAVGFALAAVAPYVILAAERARVWRNATRGGRRA